MGKLTANVLAIVRVLENQNKKGAEYAWTLEEGALRIWDGVRTLTSTFVPIGVTADWWRIEAEVRDHPIREGVEGIILGTRFMKPLKELVALLERGRARLDEERWAAKEQGDTSAFITTYLAWTIEEGALLIIGGQSEYKPEWRRFFLGVTVDGVPVYLEKPTNIINGWDESGLGVEDLFLSGCHEVATGGYAP